MSYKEVKMHMHWAFLDGIKGFYEGFNTNDMSFKFGGIVWNIIKDDLDGERSLIDYIVYGNQSLYFDSGIKERVILEELTEVAVDEFEVFSGWALRNIDSGKFSLLIGTDYSSDFYPNVIFKHFNRSK